MVATGSSVPALLCDDLIPQAQLHLRNYKNTSTCAVQQVVQERGSDALPTHLEMSSPHLTRMSERAYERTNATALEGGGGRGSDIGTGKHDVYSPEGVHRAGAQDGEHGNVPKQLQLCVLCCVCIIIRRGVLCSSTSESAAPPCIEAPSPPQRRTGRGEREVDGTAGAVAIHNIDLNEVLLLRREQQTASACAIAGVVRAAGRRAAFGATCALRAPSVAATGYHHRRESLT